MSGLKINNNNSRIPVKIKEPSFEDKVNLTESSKNEYNSRAMTLGKQIMQVINNKVIAKNKGEIEKNIENQILKDIQAFSVELNNSTKEERHCMGSTAIEAILFAAIIKFRDRLNQNEYDLFLMQEENKSLKATISLMQDEIKKINTPIEQKSSI